MNEQNTPPGQEEDAAATDNGALPTLDAMPNEDGEFLDEPPKFKGGTKSNVNKLILLVGVLVGLGALLMAGILLKKNFSKSEKPAEVAPVAAVKVADENTKTLDQLKKEIKEGEAKEDAEALSAAAEASEAASSPSAQFEGQPQGGQTIQPAQATSPAQAEQAARDTRRMGGAVILSGGAEGAAQPARVSAEPSGGSGFGFGEERGQGSRGGSGFAARLEPAVLTARAAANLPDTNYLLRQGTVIPCALITEIDTTLAGLTTCSVTQDIYSANGKVLLVERGSKINGQQTSALVQGQARVFVLWTRIDTPNGVTVNIDSPAAGQLGAAGIAGFVDTHFWERFGGAIMLSTIKDFSQIIVAKNSPNSTGAGNYENTREATENMAAKALESSINIPPTARVNAATVVSVMVARDVTFAGIYRLVK